MCYLNITKNNPDHDIIVWIHSNYYFKIHNIKLGICGLRILLLCLHVRLHERCTSVNQMVIFIQVIITHAFD